MTEDISKIQNRLFSRTVRDGGCLIWQGAKNSKGYGYFSLSGRPVKAHRASYSINVGRIPDGMMVCHRCDNPSCVEPAHLFLGDAVANMRDAASKGRLKAITSKQNHFRAGHSPRGQDGSGAKLTEAQAIEIIGKRRSGVTTKILAAEYGVDRTTIQRLVRGTHWNHLFAGRAALGAEEK